MLTEEEFGGITYIGSNGKHSNPLRNHNCGVFSKLIGTLQVLASYLTLMKTKITVRKAFCNLLTIIWERGKNKVSYAEYDIRLYFHFN